MSLDCSTAYRYFYVLTIRFFFRLDIDFVDEIIWQVQLGCPHNRKLGLFFMV